MALTIDVTVSKSQLRQVDLLLKGVPRKIPGVFRKSLNDTIRDTKKVIVVETKKITTAPVKRIKKSLTIKKAKRHQKEARITIYDERIPLINFRAKALRGSVRTLKSGKKKQTLSGVSYQINKKDTRKSIRERPLRFITTVYGNRGKDPETGRLIGIKKVEAEREGRKGHRGIFKRVGGTRSHGKLVQLFGPSIGTILIDHPATSRKIQKYAGVLLAGNIDRRINEALAGKNKGRRAAG